MVVSAAMVAAIPRRPGDLTMAGLTAALLSCSPTMPRPSAGPPAALARADFRRFCGADCAADSFQTTGGLLRLIDDGQHYRWWAWVQPFYAQVRWSRAVRVASREEIMAREGRPDWSLEETAVSVERLTVFGPGDHAPASESAVAGVMTYERVDDAWRLRALSDRFTYSQASP